MCIEQLQKNYNELEIKLSDNLKNHKKISHNLTNLLNSSKTLKELNSKINLSIEINKCRYLINELENKNIVLEKYLSDIKLTLAQKKIEHRQSIIQEKKEYLLSSTYIDTKINDAKSKQEFNHFKREKRHKELSFTFSRMSHCSENGKNILSTKNALLFIELYRNDFNK
jgi:hypothetical protein